MCPPVSRTCKKKSPADWKLKLNELRSMNASDEKNDIARCVMEMVALRRTRR